MYIHWTYIILFITVVVADKQIKLEDIERDNLISERRANQQETLKIEQPQHLRTPGTHGVPPYEASNESAENDLGEDVIYAQQPPAVEEYSGNQPSTSIQYVTPQQYDKDYPPTPTATSYTHPVHPVHEASDTYSANARESLTNPIIPKPIGTPSTYLSQQPKYIYVQAGPQQISQNGIINYGQPQHTIENAIQQQQKNAQDDINYASVEQNHIQLETSQQSSHAPNRQQNYPSRALQYFPLLTQNPNIPNYIMLLRHVHPTQTSAYLDAPIHYVPSSVQQGSSTTPTSQTLSAYIHPAGAAVLAAPESTAIPAAIQYAVPAIAQPIQIQPIEYNSHALHNTQLYPFNSPIDIYNSLQIHKHPTSLLDSYIPSSIILAAQRQRNGGLVNRHLNHQSPHIMHHATAHYQQGSHQPGYNTIAYSTAQGYSKRSPKLVTERPLKLNKIN